MSEDIMVDPGCMKILKRENRQQPVLILMSTDNRSATIDFSGDSVVFSGELPVEDAAKIFFYSFKSLWLNEKINSDNKIRELNRKLELAEYEKDSLKKLVESLRSQSE